MTTFAHDEQRTARAVLTWIAEPPDPALADLLTEFTLADVLEVIKTGILPAGRQPTDHAAEIVSQADRIFPRWRSRLDAAPSDGGMAEAARHGFRLLCPGDAGWPAGLDDLGPGQPCALWVRGAGLPDLSTASVAITDSRAATAYGAHVAGQIADGRPFPQTAASGSDKLPAPLVPDCIKLLPTLVDVAAKRRRFTRHRPRSSAVSSGRGRPTDAGPPVFYGRAGMRAAPSKPAPIQQSADDPDPALPAPNAGRTFPCHRKPRNG